MLDSEALLLLGVLGMLVLTIDEIIGIVAHSSLVELSSEIGEAMSLWSYKPAIWLKLCLRAWLSLGSSIERANSLSDILKCLEALILDSLGILRDHPRSLIYFVLVLDHLISVASHGFLSFAPFRDITGALWSEVFDNDFGELVGASLAV